MRTVGMGTKKNAKVAKDNSKELKEAYEGLLEENEKLHTKIGELEEALKAAQEVKEQEDKQKK